MTHIPDSAQPILRWGTTDGIDWAAIEQVARIQVAVPQQQQDLYLLVNMARAMLKLRAKIDPPVKEWATVQR